MGQVLISEEYLQSMADAIRQKTGTTDPITPSNFANVMEEYIPDPPTPPEPTPTDTQYGAIKVYDYHYELGFDAQNLYNCTATVDETVWGPYAEAHSIVVGSGYDGTVQISFDTNYNNYSLYWDSWSTGGSYSQNFSSLSAMQQQTGITITPEAGQSNGYATLSQVLILDKTAPTTTIILQTSNDFYGLYGNGDGDYDYSVNGTTIPGSALKEFYFGTETLTLTHNSESKQYGFLCGAHNLVYCSPLPTWAVWELTPRNTMPSHFYNCYSLTSLDISNSAFPASVKSGNNILRNTPALKTLIVGDCTPPALGDQWAADSVLSYYPDGISIAGYPHDETTPCLVYGNEASNWMTTFPNIMPSASGSWRYLALGQS